MNRIALLACIGSFGLTQLASAASITVNTVGVVNTNGHTILESTGNSLNYSTFASTIGTAFTTNNTGGVLNFDTNFGNPTNTFPVNFSVNGGETITANYGASLANSEVLTISGSGINQGAFNSAEATSSSTALGLQGDANTRTFTLSKPLLNIGIFVGNRGDSSRTSVLSVTYKDLTTASTSGANAGPAAGSNYFEDLAGTALNPIVSFSIAQNNFVRYDDLAFVVAPVPEPASLSVLGLGAIAALRRKRR